MIMSFEELGRDDCIVATYSEYNDIKQSDLLTYSIYYWFKHA